MVDAFVLLIQKKYSVVELKFFVKKKHIVVPVFNTPKEPAHARQNPCKSVTALHNLDAIIAVGYRINSKRATAFRQWATAVLRDYALRGYVIDRNRWKTALFLMKIILNTSWRK